MLRDTELGTTNETVDDSVLERYRKHSEYRPRNLNHYFGRFPNRSL